MISSTYFRTYVSQIDWTTLFTEKLDIPLDEDEAYDIADSFNTQLLNSVNNAFEEIDYISVERFAQKYYYGFTFTFQNIQLVQLQGGKLVLGLEVVAQPASCLAKCGKCIFRGYWDGNEWHTNHTE